MKSPPTETGPPNPKEEKSDDNEEGKKSSVKAQAQSEIEKDSGYSDSSSDSLSSEETNGSTKVNAPPSTLGASTVQTAYAPIYILQNIILKQPRLIVFQPSVRRHRKRPAPSSYLPILRSYPRIAPRLAPPSIPSPTPSPVPPINRPASSQLLEVSLRSLALLRRTRETQRSIRELRAHAKLYEQALHGEEGGWERLRKAMEQSGGYRKVVSLSVSDEAAEKSPRADTEPATSQDDTMTSSGDEEPHTDKTVTSSEPMVASEPMTSSEPMAASLEPMAASLEPMAASLEPMAASLDPMAASSEPMAASSEPMAASSEPMAASSEPMAASSEPMAASLEPMAASSEPMAASSEPMAASLEPMSPECKEGNV